VTTSMRHVMDPNIAEPLMLELLHREGTSRQAAMTREAAFKARRKRGSDAWVEYRRRSGEVVIGSRHEAHRIYRKQLMYYTITACSLTSLVSLYCTVFPPSFSKINPPNQNNNADSQYSCLCICIFLLSQRGYCPVEHLDHPIVYKLAQEHVL
jgi:hypothetical protein